MMHCLALIILILSILGLFHSYVFYPWILTVFSKNKELPVQAEPSDWPRVFVLIAAYNEEAVIEQKLQSILASDYPMDRLWILVGSDGSTDSTDRIVEHYCKSHGNVSLTKFGGRSGKANIVNALRKELDELKAAEEADIFIPTDANVFFAPDMIRRTIPHFQDPKVGQVGVNIVNQGVKAKGIAQQERFYISRENGVKYAEGVLFGSMMGAFGAAYAIRRALFCPLRNNFLMEDFYISMHVLKSGFKAILEPKAEAYEDLPDEIKEEFKRKVRISAGNYQNLSVYYPLLWPPWSGMGFAFLSHKLLRWLGPFMLIGAYFSTFYLSLGNPFFKILLLLQTALLFVPLLDHLLSRIGLHSVLLRFIHYFYAMNLALLLGFIRYIKGVRTNVWQPTKRNAKNPR